MPVATGQAGLILPTRFHAERDPTFRFDPEPHLYTLQEDILWSCTGMLRAVEYVDDRFYTEQSATRGKHVHKATQIIDGGQQLGGIDQEYVPYVEGWEHFVREWNFRPRLIETPMYHPVYKFGVTLDREGLTDHPGGLWKDAPTIVEIKSGNMMWWTKYQTAIQELMMQAWDISPVFRRRIGVKLSADGCYEAREFDDYNDLATAIHVIGACLANESKQWKQQRETAYLADVEMI